MKKKRKLPRYPWDKWFKKNTLVLRRGEHYHCQPHSMGVQVRSAADKRDLEVHIEIDEGTITTNIYR